LDIKKYIPSRFNAISHSDDGELILFNSYTGAIVAFTKEEEQTVNSILNGENIDNEELVQQLLDAGFIVPDSINELTRAQFLHQSQHRTDRMHLLILPTEECNFRCEYCYETFPHGEMAKDVKDGLKSYVAQKGSILNDLFVSWFGGEPLLAANVIEELSQSFIATATKFNFNYSAEIATNGYYLTIEMFKQLLSWKVNSFMVTIDGPQEVHDARRKRRSGGANFETIINNLREISTLEGTFEIHIRVNFDENNLASMEELIKVLSENFASDKRFQVYFRPVGRWGGPNNDNIPVCSAHIANEKIWELSKLSLESGLNTSSHIENALTPFGSVCYAANPNSLVISSEGRLHKCTLAFADEINQVGQVNNDGKFDLDYDKIAFWTTSGEEQDEVCQVCFFRPACQGNHCPYYRKETGDRPCSYEKKSIKKAINLVWKKYSILQKG